MEEMSNRFGLAAAAKACHIHRRRGEAAAAVKERILLRSCPEDLRIAVVSEFVAQHGRLPNAELDAERSVRQYVNSSPLLNAAAKLMGYGSSPVLNAVAKLNSVSMLAT